MASSLANLEIAASTGICPQSAGQHIRLTLALTLPTPGTPQCQITIEITLNLRETSTPSVSNRHIVKCCRHHNRRTETQRREELVMSLAGQPEAEAPPLSTRPTVPTRLSASMTCASPVSSFGLSVVVAAEGDLLDSRPSCYLPLGDLWLRRW